jgi:hypothetical protein
MEPIVFETVGEHGRKQRHGYLVPETDGLLAIDQRFPPSVHEDKGDILVAMDAQDWVITHLPSGFGIYQGDYTDAHTSARAAGIAQAFFRECAALGVDLRESDAGKIVAQVYSLIRGDRLCFWQRISACEDFVEIEGSAVESKVP